MINKYPEVIKIYGNTYYTHKQPSEVLDLWLVYEGQGNVQSVSVTTSGDVSVSNSINTAQIIDNEGNSYATGDVVVLRLSAGTLNTNSTINVNVTTSGGMIIAQRVVVVVNDC